VSTRRLVIVALAGLAFGLIAEWFAIQLGSPVESWFADLVIGVVAIWAGLVAWRYRPTDRTGLLLCLLGVTWFIGSYGAVPIPALAALASAFQGYHFLILTILVVRELRGSRLLALAGRAVALATAAVLATRTLSRLVLLDPPRFFAGCPPADPGCGPNPFLLSANQPVYDFIEALVPWALAALDAAALILVLIELIRSTGLRRRLLLPALLAAAISTASLITDASRRELDLSPDWFALLRTIFFYCRIAIPLAFLLGVVERRMARLAVADLVVELGNAPAGPWFRDSLRRALGDPSLEVLAAPADGRESDRGTWGDADRGPGRAVTPLLRSGRVVAWIVHDPALEQDPTLVTSVAAAVGLALENVQLTDALREKLEEVQASRRRIVDAADAERRRVERDIHDGAQQRLVALLGELRLARSAIEKEPAAEIAGRLDMITGGLAEATAELRELARGVRPPILADAGLAPALRALGQRSSVPVRLDLDVDDRLDPAIESAAYFVVAEAVTNTVRHSQARSIDVSARIDRTTQSLRLVVADNGAGGADERRGSGLRGLRDRVEALGGQLDVASVVGQGTRLTMELPCGS
jgi:signal transduction histidine kinase